MSDSPYEELFEGIRGQQRRLLVAAAAAGLTEEESDVLLSSLEAADLTAMASALGRPPGQVRRLLQSAFRKIQRTGLVDKSELPEVPGL